MSQTYRATGINLKSMPLGEADKILTILTREQGLIRVVAPGSRKAKSKLGGRSELFVVNDLLLSRGRSLDRLSQAESLESYPRLSRDLAKLTVSQYWAEVVLYQTPAHEPNAALFDLFCQRLTHLTHCEPGLPVLIHLIYGVMQFLSLAGVAPQLERCCTTGELATSEAIENGRVTFSPTLGGILLTKPDPQTYSQVAQKTVSDRSGQNSIRPQTFGRSTPRPILKANQSVRNQPQFTLSASELSLMQQLAQDDDLMTPPVLSLAAEHGKVAEWLNIEKALRAYVHYQTERPIRSAALIESCFNARPAALHSTAVSVAHL